MVAANALDRRSIICKIGVLFGGETSGKPIIRSRKGQDSGKEIGKRPRECLIIFALLPGSLDLALQPDRPLPRKSFELRSFGVICRSLTQPSRIAKLAASLGLEPRKRLPPHAVFSRYTIPHRHVRSSDLLRGCLARTRTYNTPPEYQALTARRSHLDAHKLRDSAQLIEIIRVWSQLPEALKFAVLAVVRSMKEEQ
jgi:hypothetical protein